VEAKAESIGEQAGSAAKAATFIGEHLDFFPDEAVYQHHNKRHDNYPGG
jgi:hypothetical protein